MYGIVNKVISDYITTKYGSDTWESIQAHAGLKIGNFVLNEMYPDEITSTLITSAADILNLSHRDLNLALGKHWALDTGLVNAPLYMCSAANDLRTFLHLLPNLHARVMLVYPEAKAPEFKCSDIDCNRVKLDYYSERSGLDDYLEGLLIGLAEHYNEKIDVRLVQSSHMNNGPIKSHCTFEISWM